MAFVPPDERDTVSWRLMNLFVMPTKEVRVVVDEDYTVTVTMRLLDDRENEAVYKTASRVPSHAQAVIIRRETLARAVRQIDGEPLEMPPSFRGHFEAEMGRVPKPEEEASWVLENCQSLLLQELFDQYLLLLQEQQRQINELKKKYSERREESQPQAKSSSESQESSEASSTGPTKPSE